MKVIRMTVEYQVTRSRDYQSVRMGGAVEVEVKESEDLKENFEKARRWLTHQVNAAAEEELESIVFGRRSRVPGGVTDPAALRIVGIMTLEGRMMRDAGKQAAGRAAAARVMNGMCVGLGSGSTAAFFIIALAERVQREGLKIRGIAPSQSSEALARAHGVPLIDLTPETRPDLSVDGADEVDAHLRLIKGGGGALVREKLVAAAAKEFIIVADASKSVDVLGAFPLPVAVVPFGWTTTQARLESVFGVPAPIRGGAETPFVSDDHLYILDMAFERIPDPAETLARLRATVGVADAGLFVGMARQAIFGNADGTIREQA